MNKSKNLAVTLLVFLTISTLGSLLINSATAADTFTFTYRAGIMPEQAYVGQTTTYTITLTDQGNGTDRNGMGSADITFPTGYLVNPNQIITVITSPVKTWLGTISTAGIHLRALGDPNTLTFDESVSVTFIATNPTTPGNYTWYTAATTNSGVGGTSFDFMLIGNYPVTSADAATLNVVGYPSPVAAGTSHSFIVTAKDVTGAIATTYTGTVHFTSSDIQAGLPADYTFTAEDGGTHTFTATLKTAGTQSITATDTVAFTITGTQNQIQVNPSPTYSLTVVGYPNPTMPGASGSFAVIAKDTYGNVATNYQGTIHFTSTDPAANLPSDYQFLISNSGIHVFNVMLNTAGTQSITATDTLEPSITGSQTGIMVNAGTLDHIIINPTSVSIIVGNTQTFTATAYDGYNNNLGSVTAFWTISGTGTPGGFWDQNTGTYTSQFAGTWTITATYAGVTADASLMVINSTVDYITISPASAIIAAGDSQTFSVEAFDIHGNSLGDVTSVTTFTALGATVNGNSVSATLPNSYTVNATYLGKSVNASLIVTYAEVSQFMVSGFPSQTVAGVAHSVLVTAQDSFGNLVTNYQGTVSINSSDNEAILPAHGILTNGTGTFIVTLNTIGSQSITATDTTTSSITGSQTGIIVHEFPSVSITPAGPIALTTGQTQTFTAQASGGIGALSYQWFIGSTLAGTNKPTYILSQPEGTYIVTCRVTDSSLPQITSQPSNAVTVTVQSPQLLKLTLTASAGPGGSISPSGSVIVSSGDSQTFTVTPNADFEITDVTVDGVSQGPLTSFQFENIQENHVIYATFTSTSPSAYFVTVISNHGAPTASAQIVAGNSFTASVTSPEGDNTRRYICTGYSVDDSSPVVGTTYTFTNIQSNHTITFNWQEQWYLTVSSAYASTTGTGWYNAGTIASISISNGTVPGARGVQYIFTGWNGDTSGTALTSSLTMNAAKTATANWKPQYYLTVNSAYGNPTGQGWYDAGSVANLAITQTVTSDTNTRNVFAAWTGTGAGAYTGTEASQLVLINNPITETAAWTIQYLVTYLIQGNVVSANLPNSEWVHSGTAATGTFQTTITNLEGNIRCSLIADNRTSTITQPTLISGTYQTQYLVRYATNGNILPIETPSPEWLNSGVAPTGTFQTEAYSSTADTRCTLISDNRTANITDPTTITAYYQTQYTVTFNQTGLSMDATGPVLNVADGEREIGALSKAIWVNNGDSITFNYITVVSSNATSKQYVLVSLNATSPLAITSSTMVHANYETQYSSSLHTVAITALALLALLIIALLLIALLRKRKKKIIATAETNGSITPSGTVRVKRGDDQTFNITADEKYQVADVKVNGASVGARSYYTFKNIVDNQTISATFKPNNITSQNNI